MSEPIRQKSELSTDSSIGCGKPSTSGYGLLYVIAAVERMRTNTRAAGVEIKPEPEDESHWVRQAPFDTAA